MNYGIVAGGALLIIVVLWDAFETIILARRVARRLRLSRFFYVTTWGPWSAIVSRLTSGNKRENYLSFYGPLSLILLLGIWAAFLVLGFSLLQFGIAADSHLHGADGQFSSYLYFSGTTFFTLGLGDVSPVSPLSRLLAVTEVGTGFLFLALVVGYLPGLSQAFSRREVSISLLDARAGSPPSALELLRRQGKLRDGESLEKLLLDWERWSAELLESHISFPVLAFFRSQHDNQSWLASLTAILDTCALIKAGAVNIAPEAATLTFAMARHAVVDMAHVLELHPREMTDERLACGQLRDLTRLLRECGMECFDDDATHARVCEFRRMYEPYVNALSTLLKMPLPSWIPAADRRDNWQGGR